MGDVDAQMRTAETFNEAIAQIEKVLEVDDSTGRFVLTGDVSNLGIDSGVLGLLLASLNEANSMIQAGEIDKGDVTGSVLIPADGTKRPEAPTITVVQAVPFHLKNPEPHIFVSWTMSTACDKYHFIWTANHSPQLAEVELTPGTGFGSSFRIPQTSAGKTYSFKVQGCQSRLLGADNCSPFSAERSITMPANTHSLRTFLTMSGTVKRLRSLGMAVVGKGLRTMMRI